MVLRIFSIHNSETFSREFGNQIALSYSQLFELHEDEAWNLNQDELISFFRVTDGSTDIVGKKQAQTFQALASISGHGVSLETKSTNSKTRTIIKKKLSGPLVQKPVETIVPQPEGSKLPDKKSRDVGLTVRIELNLPSDGNQETYDRIFKSIREYLLNE
jgi:hypothetical protein